MSGYDLKAIYSNHMIMIGNRMLIQDSNISVTKSVDEILSALEKEGKTAVLVAFDDKISEIIAISGYNERKNPEKQSML